MPKIYISYRDGDVLEHDARQLAIVLMKHFGVDNITLTPAKNTAVSKDFLRRHDVFLLIISDKFTDNNYIQNPNDYLYQEIQTALTAPNMLITSVLTDANNMPLPQFFPEELRPIIQYGFVNISTQFGMGDDIAQLRLHIKGAFPDENYAMHDVDESLVFIENMETQPMVPIELLDDYQDAPPIEAVSLPPVIRREPLQRPSPADRSYPRANAQAPKKSRNVFAQMGRLFSATILLVVVGYIIMSNPDIFADINKLSSLPLPQGFSLGATAVPDDTPETDNLSIDPSQGDTSIVVGEELFNTNLPDIGFACSDCHLTTTDNINGLASIAILAENRVEGLSARDYLAQSITEPDAYIADGYDSGTHPDYTDVLSESQIEALVEYMLTLRGTEQVSQ